MDPGVDTAIVDAAVRSLFKHGFQRMTVEGVAAEAGVAKTTVYRRYASTLELAQAALTKLNRAQPDPDTGSARTDLEALLEFVRTRFDPAITGTLLVEEARHPELLVSFRETMIGPALGRFKRVLARGIERGEVRTDADADLMAQIMLGSFFIAYLEEGRPGPDWPARVVTNLWTTLAA